MVELQTDLKKLCYGLGPCGIDGDFGRSTKAAVEQFQLDHHLGVDGICGPKTWAAIDAALKEKEDQPAPVVTYNILIKALSLDEAKKLAEQYPNSEIAEGSTTP